jgi:hypothetical protein
MLSAMLLRMVAAPALVEHAAYALARAGVKSIMRGYGKVVDYIRALVEHPVQGLTFYTA